MCGLFCTSATIISVSNGSHIALSQHDSICQLSSHFGVVSYLVVWLVSDVTSQSCDGQTDGQRDGHWTVDILHHVTAHSLRRAVK